MHSNLTFGFLAILVIGTSPAAADWSMDPSANDPVCTAPQGQLHPWMESDGTGGAIFVWDDSRNGRQVYAQRLDGNGIPRWGINGIQLCTAPGWRGWPRITTDGAGGAIVTWIDGRFPDSTTIFAQHIDSSGALTWGASGTPVGTDRHPKLPNAALVPDQSGGAIVTWTDSRPDDYYHYDIYAQHLTSAGEIARGWPSDGALVCDAVGNQRYPALVSDDDGGAIIVWADWQSGGIYAQRVSTHGTMLWQRDGLPICVAAGHRDPPVMVRDGEGGAIVAWADDGRSGLYAQHVSREGQAKWAADGLLITRSISGATILSDERGGAILGFADRPPDGRDIQFVYLQRVLSDGTLPWGPWGMQVSPHSGGSPSLGPDGHGGAIVSWEGAPVYANVPCEYAGAGSDLYAQRVDREGNIRWPTDVPLTVARGYQEEPILIPDGRGGAVITWVDFRTDPCNARNFDFTDIYAAHISAHGVLGPTPSMKHRKEHGSVLLTVPIGRDVAGAPRVEFNLTEGGEVRVEAFDVQGRHVRTLLRDYVGSGQHVYEWDGRDENGVPVRSGLYFLKLLAGGSEASARVVILH